MVALLHRSGVAKFLKAFLRRPMEAASAGARPVEPSFLIEALENRQLLISSPDAQIITATVVNLSNPGNEPVSGDSMRLDVKTSFFAPLSIEYPFLVNLTVNGKVTPFNFGNISGPGTTVTGDIGVNFLAIAGNNSWSAVADPNNAVAEFNEANNSAEGVFTATAAVANITITSVSFVDEDGKVVTSLVAGNTVYIKAEGATSNIAEATTISALFSLSGTGAPVSSSVLIGLSAGSGTFTQTLGPFTIPEGVVSYSVGYDTTGLISETNESDNSITGTFTALDPTLYFDTKSTFALHSNAGAKRVIYLDFNGHLTTDMYWNYAYAFSADINTPAYDINGDGATFSALEQQHIQEIFLRVAEDFAPFDVDVTTEDPGVDALSNDGGPDDTYGIRVVIGGENSDWYGSLTSGGVAVLGSFDTGTDLPAFVFAPLGTSALALAGAVSHEVGHTLGLSHDGLVGPPSVEYYEGHGTAPLDWSPIMGADYTTISQWSKGEYTDASNTEDDLLIITTLTGVSYRADDYTSIEVIVPTSATHALISGIIERNTDTDKFSFVVATAGIVDIQVDPAIVGGNLDIVAILTDTGGATTDIGFSDALSAGISAYLVAGTYYLEIDGGGSGDPAIDGYSDYGSLGQYTITLTAHDSGTLAIPVIAPEFEGFDSIPSTTTTAVGSIDVTFSETIDVNSFNWASVTLTRDGETNLIDATTGAGLTFELVSDTTYRIGGLSTLTNAIGDYVLTLVDGGVSDPAGNPMGTGGATGWTMHAAVPSVPVLGPTNPGPYEAGYTSSTTPTVVGTGTPGSTVELYDASDNLLTSILVDDSGTYSYTYPTLPGLGAYQVKARATEPGGYASGYSSLGTFTVATDFVSVLSITQFPTPVTAPVTAVGLPFNGELDLSSFTWEDLDIRLNGTGPNLTNSGITMERVTPSALWYRINFPTSLTAASGTYTLTVKGAGIQASNGKPVYNDISTSWTRQYNFVQINQFPTPVTSSKTAVGFQSAIALDLSSLGSEDIDLSLDGVPIINLTGLTITRSSPTALWYVVNLPASLSVSSGTYTLKVKGAGVLDIYGTTMANDISTSWVRNYQFLQINQFPTPVTSPKTAVGFQSSIALDLSSLGADDIDLSLDGVPITDLTGVTITRPSPTSLWYAVNLPSNLSISSGTYTIKVKGAGIKDTYGHAMGNDISTSWTHLPYQLVQINQFPTPITTPKTLVGFQSSIALDMASLSYLDVQLTLNGGADLITSAVTITHPTPGSLWYVVNLPPSMSLASGTYTIKVVGAGLLDIYGKAIGNDLSTTWIKS